MSRFQPTPQQSQIVNHDTGPAMVLAGAGAGKTTVLVARISRLINIGVPPEKILMMTFSNKSAKDMSDRLADFGIKVFRRGSPGVCVRTLHSMALQILTFAHDHRFITRRPAVPPEWMVHRVLLSELKNRTYRLKHKDRNNANLSTLLSEICLAKAALINPETKNHSGEWVSQLTGELYPNYTTWASKRSRKPISVDLARVFNECYAILEEFCANPMAQSRIRVEHDWYVPFDSMVSMVAMGIHTNAQWVDPWRGLYQYVLIDECQDNAASNWLMSEYLCSFTDNIMAVGDDFQSIFSWRGAKPELMRDFIERKRAAVYELNTSFRSKQAIIDAANSVVTHDADTLNNGLVCSKDSFGNAFYQIAADRFDEAEIVVDRIEHFADKGEPLSEQAVLYRQHALSAFVEIVLIQSGIPYTVSGDSVFKSDEFASFLGYVAAALDYKANHFWSKVLRNPNRFIKREVLNDIPDLECLRDMLKDMKGSSATKLSNMVDMIDDLSDLLNNVSWHEFDDVFKFLEKDLGLQRYFNNLRRSTNDTYQASHYFDALHALVMSSSEDEEITVAQAFKKVIDYACDFDEQQVRDGDCVQLSTIHAAKGLEWDHVYVIGNNRKTFPTEQSPKEEERRLFYVAITRARNSVLVTSAKKGYASKRESPFIAESSIALVDDGHWVSPLAAPIHSSTFEPF